MLQDLRLAWRTLIHQPGFSGLAILIVALGAGANASVFSIVRAVLVEPLHYQAPGRLVGVLPSGFVSNGDIDFLRGRTRELAAVASSSPGWTMTLRGAGDPVRVTATKTSANLFDVLGVRPLAGRTFAAGDDSPGQERVAILSYALWRERFGADPAAVGRTVTLEEAPYQIVGVMPPDFELLGRDAQLLVPLPFDRASPFWKGSVARAIGRLRDGATTDSAAAELRTLLPDWRAALGYQQDWGAGPLVASLRDEIVGDVRRPLLLLLAAVGLVLVLTAANVGTLLLGRGVARRRDLAVRGALGASPWRLAREALAESLLLASAGAVAGIIAARVALPPLVRMLPSDMPRVEAIGLDPLVLAVALAASAFSVLVFGTLPAAIAARQALEPLVRTARQTDAPGARRALSGLVVAQVALAVVLGAGAALMGRSLFALQRVNPGFDPAPVLTLKLQPSGERYRAPGSTVDYYRAVMARLDALPGVVSSGTIHHLPLSGYNWTTAIRIDGQPQPPGVSSPTAVWRMIDGAYFDVMRIPLLAGRRFSPADGRNAPPAVIVNQTFATRFFGGAPQAIGRLIHTGSARADEAPRIVGVVGDVRYLDPSRAAGLEIYRPMAQTFATATAIVVRTSGEPSALVGAARDAVRAIDPTVPIADLEPMTFLLRDSLARPRLLATLLLAFAACGIAVGLCGVYGVVSYTVRRREREFGIRLALGAAPAAMKRTVLAHGLGLATAGLALGLPAALWSAAAMRGLLFGVEPRDPTTFAAVAVALLLTIVGATLPPAFRAGRVEAASVLRGD